MISFRDDRREFHCRAAAIAIDDGQVLVQQMEGTDFWALPGGRVDWLEPTGDTVVREMREELGVEARLERLVWVAELFFTDGGLACHEIGFYYQVSFPPGSVLYDKGAPIRGLEDDPRLVFRWFPVDRLEALPLYPIFLRTRLHALPDSVEHMVHHEREEEQKCIPWSTNCGSPAASSRAASRVCRTRTPGGAWAR